MGQDVDQTALTEAVLSALKQVASKKQAPAKRKVTAKPMTDTADAVPTLPWGSPDALNRMLRQYMSRENQLTLGKLLLKD